jgi:hypothetical protein
MSTFVKQWKEVLIKATSLEEWPIQEEPIKLQVESAQIASTAGVLLWKEENDGKIERMRNCLQQAVSWISSSTITTIFKNSKHNTFDVCTIQYKHQKQQKTSLSKSNSHKVIRTSSYTTSFFWNYEEQG